MGPIVLESIAPLIHSGGGPSISSQRWRTRSITSQLAAAGGDSVTFHVEATDDPWRTIAVARALELGVGVALNPETPLERAIEAADGADFVLCMKSITRAIPGSASSPAHWSGSPRPGTPVRSGPDSGRRRHRRVERGCRRKGGRPADRRRERIFDVQADIARLPAPRRRRRLGAIPEVSSTPARGGIDLAARRSRPPWSTPRIVCWETPGSRPRPRAARPTSPTRWRRRVRAWADARDRAGEPGRNRHRLAGRGGCRAGTVSDAGNLPDGEGAFALGDILAEALGTRIRIGNDVQVANVLHLGAGRPYDSMIGVFWGTGVGGGLVLGAATGSAAGPRRDRPRGRQDRRQALPVRAPRCMGGLRRPPRMEEEARRLHDAGKHTELFKIMERKGYDGLKSSVWEEALDDGDLGREATPRRRREGASGAGIGSAVNLLDVEAVIIGGGLGVRFGERFRQRIEHQMRKHVFFEERPPDVVLAELGDLGGAIGAALLVSDASDAPAPARVGHPGTGHYPARAARHGRTRADGRQYRVVAGHDGHECVAYDVALEAIAERSTTAPPAPTRWTTSSPSSSPHGPRG